MIKKVWGIITAFSQPKYLFLYALLIFVLLLFRDPFSQRTLIPNLEPYPDSIHYLTPARSLVMGGPFKITREGRTSNPSVPPLYSITVIPFYFLNLDVRMFYIANVFLSIASLFLFFLILKKITSDKWVVGFTLFLFVTNFFIYWYPQWAMAENLTLPIYLAGILLLVSKIRIRNLLFASLISASFYGTKYANIPLTAVFSFLYFIKIAIETPKKNVLFKRYGFYILFSIIFLGSIFLYSYIVSGINPFIGLINIVKSFFGTVSIGSSSVSQASNSWMSLRYININLPQYLYALVGKSARFLWDFTPMVPKWVGIAGITGLIMGCFIPVKNRFLSICMVTLLISEIFFMSMFYAVDMRYIYFAIPTLLLGFSLLLSNLSSILAKKRMYSIFILIIFAFFGFYFVNNAIRIKSQIVINLKYAETPWYYISVLKLNEYFDKKSEVAPIVISPMPPYYIDYYSNGNYELLPLTSEQEFRNGRITAWGDYDYSDLHGVYRELLQKGKKLYVSTYGLGNEQNLHKSFDDLYKDFKLTEVQNECYTQCKIYKLELKNAKGI